MAKDITTVDIVTDLKDDNLVFVNDGKDIKQIKKSRLLEAVNSEISDLTESMNNALNEVEDDVKELDNAVSDAAAYASKAATSEANAKTYASNSAVSATNASTYASNALTSEQNAAASASDAETFKAYAKKYASLAADFLLYCDGETPVLRMYTPLYVNGYTPAVRNMGCEYYFDGGSPADRAALAGEY